jgi:hypothetical protein
MKTIGWIVVIVAVAALALAIYNYQMTGEFSLNLPGSSAPSSPSPNKGIKLQ